MDDLMNLDLKNAEAISRAEARSLNDHFVDANETMSRNPFAAPLSDDDELSSWVRVLRQS